MPGYIDWFTKLPKAAREAEAETKLRCTVRAIVHTDQFGTAIADTNALGWGIDTWRVTAITIGKDEVKLQLAYSASGEQDPNKPVAGRTVEGTAVVLIDDHGTVQYDKVSANLAEVQEILPPQNLLVGSTDWYEYWANIDWPLAKTGSGAMHVTVNGHELAVNEDNSSPGIWKYGIELKLSTPITWRSNKWSSEQAAKRAALSELARILSP